MIQQKFNMLLISLVIINIMASRLTKYVTLHVTDSKLITSSA